MRTNHYETLKALVAGAKIEEALALIRSIGERDYNRAENCVLAVLHEDDPTQDAPANLVEAALDRFLATHNDWYHGYWVHSLSHFTEFLWKRRMMAWIARLNEAAFQGACRTHDSNCCGRLVGDFSAFARWNDNPKILGYTPENLRWVEDEQTDPPSMTEGLPCPESVL